MSELQHRLDNLMLRLDYMGLRVEQALHDALDALVKNDTVTGQAVYEADSAIDRVEVEIEQECIRLLALYQPAAIDLRKICTVIKVNSDLERIADLAASIGRGIKHIVENDASLEHHEHFHHLAEATAEVLGKTIRILNTSEISVARSVIEADKLIDKGYKSLVQSVFDQDGREFGGVSAAMAVINLAKALERIGDHCTNIAEDIIFLRTGDIVRHSDAFENTT